MYNVTRTVDNRHRVEEIDLTSLICIPFLTPGGCKQKELCQEEHVCKFHITKPNGCSKEGSCEFRHVDLSEKKILKNEIEKRKVPIQQRTQQGQKNVVKVGGKKQGIRNTESISLQTKQKIAQEVSHPTKHINSTNNQVIMVTPDLQMLAWIHGRTLESFIEPFPGSSVPKKINSYCSMKGVPEPIKQGMLDMWYNRNQVDHHNAEDCWRNINYDAIPDYKSYNK